MFKQHRQIKLVREKPGVGVKDKILIFGLLMTGTGGLFGIIGFSVYFYGVPEHISNSSYGTTYIPAKAAGNPGFKEAAILALIVAVIGFVICAGVWVHSRLQKRRARSDT